MEWFEQSEAWRIIGWALGLVILATSFLEPRTARGGTAIILLHGLLVLGPWVVAFFWEALDPGGSGARIPISLDGDTRCTGIPLHFDIPGALMTSVLPFTASVLFRSAGCRRLATWTEWTWLAMAPLCVAFLLVAAVTFSSRSGAADDASAIATRALVAWGAALLPLAMAAWIVRSVRTGSPASVLALLPHALAIAASCLAWRLYGAPFGARSVFAGVDDFYAITMPGCLLLLVTGRRRADRAEG